jgi:hypothetical protein
MALPASGAQVSFSDINVELGLSPTAQISLGTGIPATELAGNITTNISTNSISGQPYWELATTTLLNPVGSPVTYNQGSIYWGNSEFVCLDNAGLFSTSPDGITWTLKSTCPVVGFTHNGTHQTYQVVWAGTQYIVVGPLPNKCATSPDGITWTIRAGLATAIGTPSPNAIIWDGAKTVVLCQQGVAAYSADGITWTAITTLSTLFTGKTAVALCYNGAGRYIACGATTTLSSARAAYSTDGITWTAATTHPNAIPTAINLSYSVIWDGSKFVSVANGPSTARRTSTSTDGVVWTALNRSTSPNEIIRLETTQKIFELINSTGVLALTTGMSSPINTLKSFNTTTTTRLGWTLSTAVRIAKSPTKVIVLSTQGKVAVAKLS